MLLQNSSLPINSNSNWSFHSIFSEIDVKYHSIESNLSLAEDQDHNLWKTCSAFALLEKIIKIIFSYPLLRIRALLLELLSDAQCDDAFFQYMLFSHNPLSTFIILMKVDEVGALTWKSCFGEWALLFLNLSNSMIIMPILVKVFSSPFTHSSSPFPVPNPSAYLSVDEENQGRTMGRCFTPAQIALPGFDILLLRQLQHIKLLHKGPSPAVFCETLNLKDISF